ncbi:DUF4861 domain-containing protein [Candidatus Poribacteria bacterium]|nr:DUF4861 domain-containing protein [Candidatus Poribacteria bacterium]
MENLMSLYSKKNTYRILAFLLFIILIIPACSLLGGRRNKVPAIEMLVTNTLPIKRTDEFVVLEVSKLREFAPDFTPDAFVIVEKGSNQEVPNQIDDMDNDGVADQLAMILNMEPGERKTIEIRYAPEGRSVKLGYDKRTRAAIHPEYEGLGWESELIAYRLYPDHRNSIGVFGKQNPGLSLDKFAASVKNEGYNKLEAWGVSVLEGGKLLGCGGFGLWNQGELLFPLNPGANEDSRVAHYTRIIADGPVRSIVQTIYDRWQVDGENLKVTANYSIFAGQRWTRVDVDIEGSDNPVKIGAGLISSKSVEMVKDEEDGFMYTWGVQSHREKPDELGMALIYPTENLDSIKNNHNSGAHLAVLNPGADNEIVYWFLAAWSSGELGMKSEREFTQLVSSTANNLENPLTVTIMPSKDDAGKKNEGENQNSEQN